MTTIYPLNGSLQHYVWGGKQYIPQLLGIEPQTELHYAEYWLGSHPSAPSTLNNPPNQTLNDFLARQPTALGAQSVAMFGQELPYLLKILDVAKPLSIQLHPTKQQAEIGFATENAAGIALDSPQRTYKDRNHKPEMMIALSDFWLLHGFKPKQAIIDSLRARPSLTALAEQFATEPLAECYAQVMQADQAQLSAWLLPIIQANQTAYQQGQLTADNPDYWLLYSLEAMEIPLAKLDAGLICFYLFNIVALKCGEGIYQAAGIPHAYLRGQNIELMACSDNVIRGGLTPKHIDIAELLKVIDYREVTPQIIAPAPRDQAVFTYHTPAQDFALTNLTYHAQDTLSCHAKSAEILLVMQGSMRLSCNNSTLHETALCLTQGQAAFICAETDYQIEGLEQGYAVVAKLP